MKLTFERMGDFFEAFGEEAIVVGEVLGLAVTTTRADSSVKMVGIPCHSQERWFEVLRAAGHEPVIAS